jgi:hypothetical protein
MFRIKVLSILNCYVIVYDFAVVYCFSSAFVFLCFCNFVVINTCASILWQFQILYLPQFRNFTSEILKSSFGKHHDMVVPSLYRSDTLTLVH